MRKILIIIVGLILGTTISCIVTSFFFSGGGTLWKQIDYFPYPVNEIIIMEPFGKEFWIRTTGNELFHITYPCSEKEICWQKTDAIPETFINESMEPFDYETSNSKCKNEYFVYPLFKKIKNCITSTVYAPDASWTTSLVLNENNELWIWQKPWVSPYDIMNATAGLIFCGALVGLLFGFYYSQKTLNIQN